MRARVRRDPRGCCRATQVRQYARWSVKNATYCNWCVAQSVGTFHASSGFGGHRHGSKRTSMLYSLHELQRAFLAPLAGLAGATAEMLAGQTLLPAAVVRANNALLNRVARRYE